jgi:hypothetical protein
MTEQKFANDPNDPVLIDFDENQPSVTAVCPFCQGQYIAGFDSKDGKPMLLHTLPYCARFEILDVLDFLELARLRGATAVKNG